MGKRDMPKQTKDQKRKAKLEKRRKAGERQLQQQTEMLIRMLTERNIRVPEDVSVISIDDSDLARHSEVPITSLPHPKENLGKKAAETLLQMIAGKKKDLTYEFDTRVVERESVAEHKSL